MADLTFEYGASRAKHARLGCKGITAPIRVTLVLLAIVLALVGVVLVSIHEPIGWFVVALAAWPLCVVLWWRGALKTVALGRRDSLTDRLESVLLARLPKNLTPRLLGQAAMECNGGHFFAVRFGISPNFLGQLLSSDSMRTGAVWREAVAIADANNERAITSAHVIAALIKTEPSITALLPHLNLDYSDIESGVRWNSHIGELIASFKSPVRTGGVARDWSFGYIPLLTRFGRNVSEEVVGSTGSVKLEAHQSALASMLSTFSSGGRQNVALVGPAGVGKNTIVQAFARQLLDPKAPIAKSLQFRQVFMLDPSALLSAAPGRGELEGLLTRILNEAFHAKNVILWLDNAERFLEDAIGSVDISNLLSQVLEGGGLRIILTMDEQRWLQIAQRRPELSTLLNRISVPPASQAETMLVMQDVLLTLEYRYNVTYMYQTLVAAYQLSERYVNDLAQPARSIKLLQDAAGQAKDGFVIVKSIEAAIEATTGVKVGVARGDDERQKLLNLESLIHERMINQTHAVGVVADALRRARSGVRNQNRPVGTFLFLGPTGVGKTELAKALASVYFGGEQNLVRLDLNEFSQASDVGRLIQTGATSATSLTAQVTKQPFSVILLDEIEKAHPSVLAALLQVLDEGILRDETNRDVSFRDAIIIATSNAGADDIRAHIDAGEDLAQFEEAIVNNLITSNQFRPEFLNRFDEIVTFRPLTREELVAVVNLILASINKNLATQKLAVAVDDDAKLLIVDKGYDPRLGARPMRRMVQRTVENILARRMLSGAAQAGQTIEITLADIEASLAAL
jgi:ATP-dependent Clp protease ATP-binding subunit ClpC